VGLLDDIDEILIPEAALQARIRELGRAIAGDYEGKEPLLVGILVGAFVFLSDLLRHISIHCGVDFMATSSYGDATESSGIVRILKDLDQSIEGRHVLIVDDIIDTGLTMDYLLETRHRCASAPCWTSCRAAAARCASTTAGLRSRTSSSWATAWTIPAATATCPSSAC